MRALSVKVSSSPFTNTCANELWGKPPAVKWRSSHWSDQKAFDWTDQRPSSLSMGHYIYLSDLYVDETRRKQGIGKALMDAAKDNETREYQMDSDYRTYVLILKT
jgi:GNAT superfamily N-acetyltransferase